MNMKPCSIVVEVEVEQVNVKEERASPFRDVETVPADISQTNGPECMTWDVTVDSLDDCDVTDAGPMSNEGTEIDPLSIEDKPKKTDKKRGSKDTKTDRKKVQREKPYTQSELEEALNRIRAKEISLTAASKTYSIPKTTLHYQLRVSTPLMLGENEPEAITCDVEISLDSYSEMDSLETEAEAAKRKVRRKERLYTQEELAEAVEKIRKEELTLNQASKAYGIPKTTLHSKLHGKTALGCKKGPDRILSKEDENYIATWVADKIRNGDRVGIDDVKEAVAKLFEDRGQPRNKPGTKWYRLFRQRYRSYFLRKLQGKTDHSKKGLEVSKKVDPAS